MLNKKKLVVTVFGKQKNLLGFFNGPNSIEFILNIKWIFWESRSEVVGGHNDGEIKQECEGEFSSIITFNI